jgi:hypothetical protein
VRLNRLAGLTAAGALTLAIAAPAMAADAAKLTAVVTVDDGAPTAGNVWVRVLHASPDAPSVDVFVNDGKVDALSGAEFGDVTEYVEVPAGSYDIKVCATADNSVCVIDLSDVALPADAKVTIAAAKPLAEIMHYVFVDGATPADGNTAVRVVHLSHDTPAVDVLTQDGATKVVENLAFPNATDYLELPAGSYDLKVCANADNTVCPLDPGALNLEAGKTYSVWAIGSLAAAIEPPPTDTATSFAPFALILALMAVVGLGLGLRFAPASVRR